MQRSAALRHAVALAALCMSGACATFGARWYRGPVSDHFDGRRFHNYVRVADAQLEDALRLELHTLEHKRGRWTAWEDVPTDTPPSRVGNGALRVTFVNHATVLLQMDSLNILTDPVWADRISPTTWVGPERHRPAGIRLDDLPPIDLILLSHDHYDHMDVPTLRTLVARFHPRIVTGLGNAAYLARQGIDGVREIDWWQGASITPRVRVTGVPAQHWSARSLTDKWRRLWLGFVIESPSGPVYFAGDTGFGPFFSMIRDRFPRFRLAVLPIAPERPRAAMAPRHASAGEAVQIDSLLGASTALAVHFGTFRQGDDAETEPVDSLRAALDARGACAPRFWAFRNGEARLVPPVATATAVAAGCTAPARRPGRGAWGRNE